MFLTGLLRAPAKAKVQAEACNYVLRALTAHPIVNFLGTFHICECGNDEGRTEEN